MKIALLPLAAALLASCTPSPAPIVILDHLEKADPEWAKENEFWQLVRHQLGPETPIEVQSVDYQNLAALEDGRALPADIVFAFPSRRSSAMIDAARLADLRGQALGQSLRLNPLADPDKSPIPQASYILAPSLVVNGCLVVNLKLLAQLGLSIPQTLEQWQAQVPALKAKGLAPLILVNQNSATLIDGLYSTLLSRFPGPGAEQSALEAISKLVSSRILDPAPKTQAQALEDFKAGRSPYWLEGDWVLRNQLSMDVAFAPLPTLPGQKGADTASASLSESFGYAINASLLPTSERFKQALKVLSAIASPEVAQFWLSIKGPASSRLDASAPFSMPALRQRLEFRKSTPLVPTYSPSASAGQLVSIKQKIQKAMGLTQSKKDPQ